MALPSPDRGSAPRRQAEQVLPAPPPVGIIRLEASHGWTFLHLKEVWRYRELLWFLAARDIKIRYKQTALGASWALLQPVATALIFTVVFGRLVKVPSEGLPYPLFALAGLVPWTFFSTAVTAGAMSLVGSANLVSKVYFPRLCVPTASVLGNVVDLLIASCVVFVAMASYGVWGGARVLVFPAFALLAVAAALALSLWLSAIAGRYRDVKYVVPFLMQIWLFLTPVAYSSTLLGERWHFVYGLNPMVAVVEGFRWSLLGTDVAIGQLTLTSAASILVVLVTGAYYFRRMERTLADVI